jgi:holliday junction DNA helicase RuvA
LMVVREDAITLYGFHSEAERQLFRDLLRVNGVGPKLALSILSAMELATFAQAIRNNDTARLIRIPGVGKKTAERLVLEMRDRLDKIPLDSPTATPSPREIISPVDDAVSVLIALGYKPQEASRLVYSVKQDGMTSEELIRRALQAAL